MKSSIKRILSIMLSAIFMIAALFVYINYVKPEFTSTQELIVKLEAQTSLYEEQSQAIGQVQDLINKSKGSYQEALALALPSKEGVSDILAQIEAISQASGVNLNSFALDYLPITANKKQFSFVKNVGALKVDLAITGSYEGFKKMIESLETNVRVMDVEYIKIEPSSISSKNSNFYSFNITITTYYQTD